MAIALLIIGLAGFFLSGCVFIVSVLLPVVSNGKTSWDEAMMGIIPGGCCSLLSLVIAAVGLILMLTAKKEPRSRPRDEEEA
jgi:hypothetical protein